MEPKGKSRFFYEIWKSLIKNFEIHIEKNFEIHIELIEKKSNMKYTFNSYIEKKEIKKSK